MATGVKYNKSSCSNSTKLEIPVETSLWVLLYLISLELSQNFLPVEVTHSALPSNIRPKLLAC
ncbi:hypothetical protein ACU8KH_00970 [Lachancea thermotolerans]